MGWVVQKLFFISKEMDTAMLHIEYFFLIEIWKILDNWDLGLKLEP